MKRTIVLAIVGTILVGLAMGMTLGQKTETTPQMKALEAAGPGAKLTIYPVHALGRADRNIADVLGLVLEKHGMTHLDAVDTPFDPASDEWDKTAQEFAALVKDQHPDGYALFAEFLGDPQQGPTEVRWVLVDSSGAIVISDRQTPQDRDFKSTAARDPDPMGCSMLVAKRLFAQAHWKANNAPDPDGKFARRWAEKSGLPSAQVRAEMQQRAAAMTRALKGANVAVYPTIVNGEIDEQSGQRLAELMSRQFGCRGSVIDKAAALPVAESSNQMKRAWDLGRALAQHIRDNPPTADYVAIADYIFSADATPHALHVVVCDRNGELVIVDLLNNQHDAWAKISPKSIEDCDRLAVTRIARHLDR